MKNKLILTTETETRVKHNQINSYLDQIRRSFGTKDGLTTVAFFPGLGSRSAYRDVNLKSVEAISSAGKYVYKEASRALGQVPTPQSLALDYGSLPEDSIGKQAYISAAFLTHNLAIYYDLEEQNRKTSDNLQFVSYTGESLGMLAAAVASGSLHVRDGVLLAYAFTPILLGTSNQHPQEDLLIDLESYIPSYTNSSEPISEPAHVIAIYGQNDKLEGFIKTLDKILDTSVELHKRYSSSQYNIYVTESAIPDFVRILRSYPEISAKELKGSTKFMAHSHRMFDARMEFSRFIDDHGIVFYDPHTPLISNNRSGFLITGDQVRSAILAMVDEIMDSQYTTELIDNLSPDLVLEIGRGKKSLQLLQDNAVSVSGIDISDGYKSQNLVYMAKLAQKFHKRIFQTLEREDKFLSEADISLIRELTNFSAHEKSFDMYLRKEVLSLAFDSIQNSSKSLGNNNFQEALQYTLAHYSHVNPGEIVLNARLCKPLKEESPESKHSYLKLRILNKNGVVTNREVSPTFDTEVLIIHFEEPTMDYAGTRIRQTIREELHNSSTAIRIREAIKHQVYSPNSLDDFKTLEEVVAYADAIDHIVYQLTLFQHLQQYRPGICAHAHVFFEAIDFIGWITSLVVSEALEPGSVIDILIYLLLHADGESPEQLRVLTNILCENIKDSKYPLLSTAGTPVLTQSELRTETLNFLEKHLDGLKGSRPIKLHATAAVIALAYGEKIHQVDAYPQLLTSILIQRPEDLWKNGQNKKLDDLESHALLNATYEHQIVKKFAQSRNILYSTVNAYVNPDEHVFGFGTGGSESMTIFFRREGDHEILVRKILSEALTTAHWDINGIGVMLPPFTKAKRQAEYLAALPDQLHEYFPQVRDITERILQTVDNKGNKSFNRELIYEMTYIEGLEVGQYVYKYSPPTAVIARLYEVILNFIHKNVHNNRCVSSPGDTLEEQYYRKIEDRLTLCRQTAPETFSSGILDTDEIIINGNYYRNYRKLLSEFRGNPDYARILEPHMHTLVIGDTNTENIKIGDVSPLENASHCIRVNKDDADIQEALNKITPESINLKFLDPRAIGFQSEGAGTVDDPMYDNKPWHNSIGHYDEMHNEMFDLNISIDNDSIPKVSIIFHKDNPYQKVYQIRDVTEHGYDVDIENPRGLEDYFAQVMDNIYKDNKNMKDQCNINDPYWIIRFVFIMGTHFTAMPPFHFTSEIDGTIIDSVDVQRRPLAIYCEGIKWLNWALEMLEGTRDEFLGVPVNVNNCHIK